MRTVIKPFKKSLVVLGITSCLTTLQFTSVAYAQGQATTTKLTKEERQLLNEAIYATPSILLAPQRGFQIETGYTRSEGEIQIENLDGVAKISSDSGKTSMAYGINSNLYIGVGVGYGSAKMKSDFALAGQGAISTSNTEGMTDPNLLVGGRMNFTAFSIIGGLDYLASTGKGEVQLKSGRVTDRTAKTGGSEITPSIAVFSNNRQKLLLGASLGYKTKTPRKTDIKDPSGFVSEATTKGGNETELNLFLETPQISHSFGAVLTYKSAESTQEESITVRSVKGTERANLTAFANVNLSKTISIIPSASYMHFINDKVEDTDLKSQSFYSGQLNLRISF